MLILEASQGCERLGLALEFSFAPSEIRQFVTPEAHDRHKIDLARARLIYESLEKSKDGNI
jgi:hypothetical protein